MKRTIATVLTLAAILCAAPAAFAQDSVDIQQLRDETVTEIENLFQDLLGIDAGEVTFRDHGDGLVSLEVSLPADAEPMVEIDAKARKKTSYTLATGLSLIDPTRPSSLINNVSSDTRFEYNYWWVVANTDKKAAKLKTVVKLSGPGKTFSKSWNLEYPKKSVMLYSYDPKMSVNKAGVYTLKTVVAKSGAALSRTYADAN